MVASAIKDSGRLKFWENYYRLRKWVAPVREKIYQGVCHLVPSNVGRKSPLVILTSGRTGSTFFVDCLNSVPQIFIYEELLNHKVELGLPEGITGKKAADYLAKMFNLTVLPIYGVKLQLYQLRQRELSFAELPARFPNAKYIVMYRKDLLKAFLSNAKAIITSQWVVLPGQKKKNQKIGFDPLWYEEYCQRILEEYQELIWEPTIRKQALFVDYESLSEDRDRYFEKRVFPFLGLPTRKVRTNFIRQSNYQCPTEVVSNPEAIKPYLDDWRRSFDPRRI